MYAHFIETFTTLASKLKNPHKILDACMYCDPVTSIDENDKAMLSYQCTQ